VPRALPVLAADREVLARAVRNLLENAARHAPPGTTVDLRAMVVDGEVWLEVDDRGPGVPRAERRTILMPFVRGAAARAVPGSGLGLALVERAVRLHHGRVEVLDRAGGGASFRLRLPAPRTRRRVS
jgi:signal transduction histidine kinase